MSLLFFLCQFHCFSDSDDEATFGIISEVELINEIGDELKKPTASFPKISIKSERCFDFF